MSEPPTPNEAALLEAIEAQLASLDALLRAHPGWIETIPPRMSETPARVCARCNRKLMARAYNVRDGLYYHVTCTPTR